jgi:hypothetical protein
MPMAVGLLHEPELLHRFHAAIHTDPLGPQRFQEPVRTYLDAEAALGRVGRTDAAAATTLLIGSMIMLALTLHLGGRPRETAAAEIPAVVAALVAGLRPDPRLDPLSHDGAFPERSTAPARYRARPPANRTAPRTVRDLYDSGVDAPDCPDRLLALRNAGLLHAKREERYEFPHLRHAVAAGTLERLTAAVLAAEAFAPTRPHPGVESAKANLATGPVLAVVDRHDQGGWLFVANGQPP